MTKFNTPTIEKSKTVNKAGGEAFKQSPQLELVSILLTSMVENQFYEKVSDKLDRLSDLMDKVDPLFAAKAAIFARNEIGMRSISHVTAVNLGKAAIKTKWGPRFYEKVARRPDDVTEILALNQSKFGKAITHAMRKGLGKALGKFDEYQLGKYRGERNSVSLVDAVNLLHPDHTEAISKLINGKLKSKTWEAGLSAAGKTKNVKEEKKMVWGQLLSERKLGYMALLRNLRNILDTGDKEVISMACTQLVDEKQIKKSLLFPYRFYTAFIEIGKLNTPEARLVSASIAKALDVAVNNIPKMERTCVVIDSSGSMTWNNMSDKSESRVIEAAAVLGVGLAKSNNSDVMLFDGSAKYFQISPMDSVIQNMQNLMRNVNGGATNFNAPFETFDKAYDRIIILSDMQGWVGYRAPTEAFRQYKRRFNSDPKVYSIDLTGNGSLQFPENNVYEMAGFSDKIFDVMKLLETDKKALINTIDSIEL